jgi:glutathione S-transferase
MRVYFIPFACSLAVRAALYEAGLEAEFVRVRPDAPLPDGRPFTDISPLSYASRQPRPQCESVVKIK